MGDYVDSFDIGGQEQLENLRLLVEFKEKTDSVFLIGNHDAAYLYPNKTGCSGYQPLFQNGFQNYLKQLDLKVATVVNGILITHAGVTSGWLRQVIDDCDLQEDIDITNPNDIAELLNWLGGDNPYVLMCGFRRGGHDSNPGPLWCDMRELCEQPLTIPQIVGHTQIAQPLNYHNLNFIDCGQICQLNGQLVSLL